MLLQVARMSQVMILPLDCYWVCKCGTRYLSYIIPWGGGAEISGLTLAQRREDSFESLLTFWQFLRVSHISL